MPIGEPLEKIAKLSGVYYDWDKVHGGSHDLGMIAEEVGAVLPEIVQYEENGVDAIGMDYSKMTPLLVEAVNALRAEKDAQVAALRAEMDGQRRAHGRELEALRAENMVLRDRLAALESMVGILAKSRQGDKP